MTIGDSETLQMVLGDSQEVGHEDVNTECSGFGLRSLVQALQHSM